MRFIRSILALAFFAAAMPLTGQVQEREAAKGGRTITVLSDSLELKATPELQKALEDLAAAVEGLAIRIANDRHLRAAAVQVAAGLVTTAQHVVEENSVVIQEALKTAAEKIATAETTRKGSAARRP